MLARSQRPGEETERPWPSPGGPPSGDLQPGPKLSLLRSPAGHASQLRLENPSWRLPIPELRQNHVNSDLVSGWVAVRNALQPEDEGGGTASSRHPGPAFHTPQTLRGVLKPELGAGTPGTWGDAGGAGCADSTHPTTFEHLQDTRRYRMLNP